MKKEIITGFILGVCVAAVSFYAWHFYQLEKQVQTNTQAIQQVVGFLNEQIKDGQKQEVKTEVKK